VLPVVLASASPRRKELLREVVPEFEVVVAPVDEEALTVPDPWETAERLALAKARAVFALRPEARVIGGDTVVAYSPVAGEYVQLAKPCDDADAVRMLRALSGREHVVVTGVAIVSPAGARSFTETTRVFFHALTDAEILDYVAQEQPMDKAGAYGIQGGAKAFVDRLEGSWSNVVGLPVERLAVEFSRLD
jgi:septum formation protein